MSKKTESNVQQRTTLAETTVNPPVSKFNKQQILKSKRYTDRRDLLTALLKDGERYSHADVQTLIDEFMKGKVK